MPNTIDDGAQLTLFDVQAAYATAGGALSNDQLYSVLAKKLESRAVLDKTAPIGKANNKTSPLKRKIRWWQQTLKAAGILERTQQRGVWQMSQEAKTELTQNVGKVTLIGFSTDLGVALWGLCKPTFDAIDTPIALCLTSPPYLLRRARAYGNPQTEQAYIDFITQSLEPIVARLAPTGSVALNISNDCFEPGSPARSLYRERLVLALHDRLGLSKMDELIWQNESKAPGPTQWACKTRQQLCTQWEPVYLFSPDPKAWGADNGRVRQAHSERYLKYLERPDHERRVFSDGAYVRDNSSYRNHSGGKIPRNILRYGHGCADQRAYKKAARELGLPAHGAPFPISLASFLIEYLTRQMELVVDPFGGSMTTGKAAELAGRRWLCTEAAREYVVGAATRFRDCDGFALNEGLLAA